MEYEEIQPPGVYTITNHSRHSDSEHRRKIYVEMAEFGCKRQQLEIIAHRFFEEDGFLVHKFAVYKSHDKSLNF